MRSLFLSPHNDDAVLFGTFLILEHRPSVITVLRSQVQEDRGHGVGWEQREAEDAEAFGILGAAHRQWPHLDRSPNWDAVRENLESYVPASVERVFAPLPETHGHDHHNAVGNIALDLFGTRRVTLYTTYTPAGRTAGVPVPFRPEWVTLKLRAMACYRSQIEVEALGCTEHFVRDLREYTAS